MARRPETKSVTIGGAETQTRPSDDRRLRIVTAAESVFSERGYDAGTLREIASRAGVPLSLITYHYADKLGLYRAIFEARVPQIVQQRLAGLALADLETDPERRLDLIVKALLVPMLGLRATKDGRMFATLLAREVADPSSIQRGVVQGFMRPVTSAFLGRLKEALPTADETAVLWAYGSMIGAMLYMLAGGGSMKDVTNGSVDPDDVRACTDHLVGIALAGFRR
ncbi:MAG: TetR/AcrR family transcriptional regulator [Janthinobacterium lividum]